MATLRDSYNTGNDDLRGVTNTTWYGQTIQLATTYSITSVKLLLFRSGSPGTVTVSIRATAAGLPTGADLTSGTTDGDTLTTSSSGEWREITFSSAYTLTGGTTYAICVRSAASGLRWNCDSSSPTYANGSGAISTNSGSTWIIQTNIDFMFEAWGEDVAAGNGVGAYVELINTFVGKLFGHDLQFRPEWNTELVTYDTGKEQRNQVWSRPRRHWVLPYNVMLTEYRNKLLELALRAKGMYNVFLFEDPYDYECALTECSITAIAAQTDFQLIKSYYPNETETWNENKTRIQPGDIFQPVVKVDDVLKTEGVDYTLDDDTGIVTFGAAPGVDAVVTANYRFYYPVRFDRDIYEETAIINSIFNMGDIPIIEVIE